MFLYDTSFVQVLLQSEFSVPAYRRPVATTRTNRNPRWRSGSVRQYRSSPFEQPRVAIGFVECEPSSSASLDAASSSMTGVTAVVVLLAISCLALPACTKVDQQRPEQPAHVPLLQQDSQLSGGSVPLLPFAEHVVAHTHRRRALRGHPAQDAPATRRLALENNINEEAQHGAKDAAAASAAATSAGFAAARASAHHSAADGSKTALTAAQAHELLNATSAAMPRLMQPLPADGKAALERHRACAAFYTRPVKTVALVGNGPLTEAQRLDIEAADLVIRFNKLNNRSGRVHGMKSSCRTDMRVQTSASYNDTPDCLAHRKLEAQDGPWKSRMQVCEARLPCDCCGATASHMTAG